MLIKSLFKALTVSVLLMATTVAHAQNETGWRIGFGVSPGVPIKDPFAFTLGGDVRLQKNFNNKFAATLTAGFTHYFEKDHFIGYSQYGSPFNVIPVKAGAKFFLYDNLYVAGEAGAGFGFEQWGTSFLWSPSVGVAFKNGLDLSIRYEDFTRSSVTKDISLRLAYGLDTRKLVPHKRTNGDSDWKLAIGLNPGISQNDGFVLGGEAGIYKPIARNLEAYATAGVTHYFDMYQYYYNMTSYDTYSYGAKRSGKSIIPVKAGLRLYAGNQFYISGDAGAAFVSDGDVAFAYSPTIGLAFKNGVDIGAKYDGYTGGNYIPSAISLKLAYRFKL
ncbi:hypothetical protein [Mucilaginibacter jinjuensis]|uniref:OmpL-like beta-barrel porin-2 n=1 Tax=Mucilaginibacter jinjuensis TaxID=1176721 RepID=A0ABY7TFJ5_9SPHI|nr:hypothetical protein [Mucilaginibacter jinjuensis]WCT14841.1 hypothetical protein PQO05_12925 [Mucilaginibacter jinjuensis]